MNDIATGTDVTCRKCQLLREQGYPRPSCEECGLVELTEANSLVWEVFSLYGQALVTSNGMGGFSINVLALKEVLKEYDIDCFAEFMRRLALLILALFNKGAEEANE